MYVGTQVVFAFVVIENYVQEIYSVNPYLNLSRTHINLVRTTLLLTYTTFLVHLYMYIYVDNQIFIVIHCSNYANYIS